MTLSLSSSGSTIYKGDDVTIAMQLRSDSDPWPIPDDSEFEVRLRPASGSNPVTLSSDDGEVVVANANAGILTVNINDAKTALLLAGESLPVCVVVTTGDVTRTFELVSAITIKPRTIGA